MGNPRQQVLKPEYITLKSMLERGNKIYADLSQRGQSWCIQLQEEPPEVVHGPVFSEFDKLNQRVDWCCEQLKSWTNVRRTGHDIWYFSRKRDAEKFQTLYNLKWASE
jgi:hypothetical protein